MHGENMKLNKTFLRVNIFVVEKLKALLIVSVRL